MNRLAVWKKYDSQKAIFHLRYLNPSPDPTIRLDVLTERCGNRSLDPFVTDHGAIGPRPHRGEVGGDLHLANVANGAGASKLRPRQNGFVRFGGGLPPRYRGLRGEPRRATR